MAAEKSTFGLIGIGVVAVALMLALVHFWAGPFSPQSTLEQIVAETAVSIRDATVAALKGKTVPEPEPITSGYDLDKVASVATATLGGLAVILAVIGIALREPVRPASGAAALGVGAIAFQFAAMALGIFVLVILGSAVLGSLGFSSS